MHTTRPSTLQTLGIRRRQRGAIAVVVAFSLVVLVLMLGLVLDLGHLYVTKSELQNAADSCALSAARELNDLGVGALDRATAAGRTAGNRHSIDLQAVSLRAEGAGIEEADVTFSDTLDGTYRREITANTKYVRCAPRESNVKSVVLWFMGVAGLTDWNLSAQAVARTVGGQGPCAIPVAVCTTVTASTPNLGFTTGTWYTGRLASGSASQGNYDWVRFSGTGSADLGEVLAGQGMCDVGPALVDAEPGISGGTAQAWNTRFGLYSGRWNDIDLYPPDRTGWAYTGNRLDNKGNTLPGSWPQAAPQNAYPDYVTRKNTTHDPYNPTALLDDNGKPSNLPGNPSPLDRVLHGTKGQDRRMVFVPVISCSAWAPNKKNMDVLDYACAFMISPINDPGTDVQLEFRGLLSKGACATSGIPGNFGPPVPALVR
ncbi:MAG: pilus assembly protein TadG-related protein [Pseudomonadota bacterium]